MTKPSIFILLFGFLAGCSSIEQIVMPINNATIDLNQTSQNFNMPTGIFPETELKFRGTKLVIEKNF